MSDTSIHEMKNNDIKINPKVVLSGSGRPFYQATFGPTGFTLNHPTRWGHEIPGQYESHYGWMGLGDEYPLLVKLAFTDIAYAELDDLTVNIKNLSSSAIFGNNDPGKIVHPTLDTCLASINESYEGDPDLPRLKALFGLIAAGDKPNRFFFRIREAIIAAMTPTYDPDTHTITVSIPHTIQEQVPLASDGVPGISKKQLAVAVTEYMVVREGDYRTAANGVTLQVRNTNGVGCTLEAGGPIGITIQQDGGLGSSEVSVEEKDLGIAKFKDVTGFSVPTTVWNGDTTISGTYNDQLESHFKEDGQKATVSKYTILERTPHTFFESLGTAAHQNNACALSLAYAGLVSFRKKYGPRIDTVEANATTISELQDEAALPYLLNKYIRESMIDVLDSPLAAKNHKVAGLFTTRRYVSDKQVVWSIDASKKVASPICRNSVVRAALARIDEAVAEVVGDSETATVHLSLSFGEDDYLVTADAAFDTDDDSRSDFCTEYSGDFACDSGYGNVRTGSTDGVRIVPADPKNPKRAEIFQSFWAEGALIVIDAAQFIECIRLDAESEWAAAIASIKHDNQSAYKTGKCSGLGLALALGAGIVIATSSDDDDDEKKKSKNNEKAEDKQASNDSSAPAQPSQITINLTR